MGQRGQLDRIPVAHTAPVTALDWCHTPSNAMPGAPTMAPGGDITNGGLGWIVSGGLDRCVKVNIFADMPFLCLNVDTGLGPDLARNFSPYPSQTDVHLTSFVSGTSGSVAPVVRMRDRHSVECRTRNRF